jgi:glutamate racemase
VLAVFDSGIGGLTIARALRRLLPALPLRYFGDTAHLPYGDKSPELIRSFCRKITRFLLSSASGPTPDLLVVACNTASAVALETIQQEASHFSVPVVEVITPAVEEALKSTKNDHIGVIGTRTTIASHAYLKQIQTRRPLARVTEKATPLLVPMIEEGFISNNISSDVLEAYLSDTGFAEIDTLILGCTHYPLIAPQVEASFKRNFSRSVAVIDSSLAVARRVKELLEISIKNPVPSPDAFYVSDLTTGFAETARLFFGQDVPLTKINPDLLFNH